MAAVRSDLVTLNASNHYLDRGVLVWCNRAMREPGWQLYSLEDNNDFHVVQSRGNYVVSAFNDGKRAKLYLSTKATAMEKETVDSPFKAALVIRDKLLLAGVNSGTVRIVNGAFLAMHEFLLALGGRYRGRSKRGVETVEFDSNNVYSQKFETFYPDVRVTFAEREVAVSVHGRTRPGKSKETKVHGHPTRVTHRAAAKRRGRTK